MNELKKAFRHTLAMLLCVTIVCSQTGIVYAAETQNVDAISEASVDEESTGEVVVGGDDTLIDVPQEAMLADSLSENVPDSLSANSIDEQIPSEDYYKDGAILIYNRSQLLQIGTDRLVYTGDKDGSIGKGSQVLVDGEPISYQNQNYLLMNDIAMDETSMLSLLQQDAVKFASNNTTEEATTVYDAATDSIYIYNRYQLALLFSDEEMKTVTTGDYKAANVGVGQVITDQNGELLSYDRSHNYVLSSHFTTDMPVMMMNLLGGNQALVGNEEDVPYWEKESYIANRDYFGQVVRTDGEGKEYILIGNETQLRAIGSGLKVTEPIWELTWKREITGYKDPAKLYPRYSDWTLDKSAAKLAYPGDADLLNFGEDADFRTTALYDSNAYSGKKITETWNNDSGLIKDISKATEYIHYSPSDVIDVEDGSKKLTYKTEKERPSAVDTLKYASATTNISKSSAKYDLKSNYIIFRDIDLDEAGITSNGKTDDWTPIENFSGTMQGSKNMGSASPKIHGVTINQTEALRQKADVDLVTLSKLLLTLLINPNDDLKLDVVSQYGVGFFRNLTTPYNNITAENGKVKIGSSGKTIQVSNLTLDEVSVTNSTNKVDQQQSLVSIILNTVLAILTIKGSQPDEESLATGGFVGVVKGNVAIDNCHVTNLKKVSNVNKWTGGFVGYTSGIATYEAVSALLGGVALVLTKVLNVIPFVGLGDLVKILLDGGVLDAKSLIPVSYTNATLKGCTVSYRENTSNAVNGTDYVGGFSGESTGTLLENCKVHLDAEQTIKGDDYVGGFIGKMSNAVISGLLQNLGVDILANFPINTILLKDEITGEGALNVVAQTSKAGTNGYAGGFAGTMSNSYAVDCHISNLKSVQGRLYAGGFAGKASAGDLVATTENKDLLNLLSNVLTGLLSGKTTDMSLLNLIGVRPSVIAGCTIKASQGLRVQTSDEAEGSAGGFVGDGGAVQIINLNALSDQSHQAAKDFHKMMNLSDANLFEDKGNAIAVTNGNLAVKAAEHAGGVLGKGKMVGVADVLGGTVGAGNYIRFEVSDLTLTAPTIEIEATATGSDAGGVIGSGIGGTIKNVKIEGLAKVKADKAAGGFAGVFGSGRLADVGGINLLGLNVLKVDGIAGVSDMIETKVSNSFVTGVTEGYKVATTSDSGTSGGFIGQCISGSVSNAKAENLFSVTASMESGKAGGFIGDARAGDAVATLGESLGDKKLSLLEIENLVSIAGVLTPEFHQTSVAYVGLANPQVEANMAGGYIGDGEAVDINASVYQKALKSKPDEKESLQQQYQTKVTGLQSVVGTTFAGGFAGRLQPGNLAQTGSIKLLGLLDATQLLSVMDVSFPEIANSTVESEKLTVTANGKAGKTNLNIGEAGGFVGSETAAQIENSNVKGVKSVKAPYRAGGYAGFIQPGSAASVGNQSGADLLNKVLGKVLDIGQLTGLLQAGSSKITNSAVFGTDDGLVVENTLHEENKELEQQAQGYAGGFVGQMQSGLIDNEGTMQSYTDGINDRGHKGTAVSNLKAVKGLRYAGGFGGKVSSGAVAAIGSGETSILSGILASNLLSLINTFVPVIKNASVRSIPSGFTVEVTGSDVKEQTKSYFKEDGTLVEETEQLSDSTQDHNTGSAGGFIGHAVGVQVSSCDVDQLARTKVTEPENLQTAIADSYYDTQKSSYAVKAYRYAGGFFGRAEPGSTASIGGANVLSKLIGVENLLTALSVAASVIDNSDVYGAIGGFNVIASNSDGTIGKAGGFGGAMEGVQIQDSNVYQFYHIIGRESAGGYAGTLEPASVAKVGDVSLIGKLGINVTNLLDAVNAFIPVIKNSETTCIPCGGVVRAQAESSDGILRGTAGGYAGHNLGGQIWGFDTKEWKNAIPSEDIQKECAAVRIRSVFGTEYAGGYTGYMQCGSLAEVGNLGLLGNLVKADNLLQAIQAVYPTETNTAVYGPLKGLDLETWNSWVTAVGSYGAYGDRLHETGTVNDNTELAERIQTYAYGYDVTAGRQSVAASKLQGSAAGGYVGRMEGGVITAAMAEDVKQVDAFRAAGGFAGEMRTGSLVNTGGISALGIAILKDSLNILNTFVPVIKNSSAAGYQSGAVIEANGFSENKADNRKVGFAGGYVGYMAGGQIWGNEEQTSTLFKRLGRELGKTNVNKLQLRRCQITKLRRVVGQSYVGGFVGKAEAEDTASVDVNSSKGILNTVLGGLISSAEDLLELLNATLPTIRYADVEALDDWGIEIQGIHGTRKAIAAGGFAGAVAGIVIGDKDKKDAGANAINIRSVTGGEYAGGFVGKADSSSVAQVSSDGGTKILEKLVQLGKLDALSVFRPCVYYSKVEGCADGLDVTAAEEKSYGTNSSTTYSGNAGGFAGELRNGTIKNSHAKKLELIEGINSTGGFIGYSGKSGVVSADEIEVIGGKTHQLLGGSLGLLDIIGSTVEDCSASGMQGGYSVVSSGKYEAIAGGFIGYADLAQIKNSAAGKDLTAKKDATAEEEAAAENENTAYGLNQVVSSQTAGGFAGKTSHAYLLNAELDSTLANVLFKVVNGLLKILLIDKLETLLPKLVIIPNVLELQVLGGGNAVYVNLLGIRISVSLASDNGTDAVATVKIGNSTITLPVNDYKNKNGEYLSSDDQTPEAEEIRKSNSEVKVNLLKANKSRITNSSVYGVADGYDVLAAVKSKGTEASVPNGYAGGFVGYNDEGRLEDNNMYLCDVIQGNENQVGPFTGKSILETAYEKIETLSRQEGNNNIFRIYRLVDESLDKIVVIEEDNSKTEDGKTEDSKAEGSKTEDGKTEDGKTEDSKAEDGKTEGSKAEGSKTEDGKTEDSKAEGSKTDDSKKDSSKEVLLQSQLTRKGSENIYELKHIESVTTLSDLKNAKLKSSASDKVVDLNAYRSPAKVVLMGDAGSELPDHKDDRRAEPSNMQDPCDEYLTLTINKIWRDMKNQDKLRPDNIRLTITRKYKKDGKLIDDDDFKLNLTMSKETAGTRAENIWRTVLTDIGGKTFPAYKVKTNADGRPIEDENGKYVIDYYYTYFVNESDVPNYSTSIVYNNDHTEATITNRHFTILPDTGGWGNLMYLLLGGGVLAFMGYTTYRRKKKKGVAA